MSLCCAARPRSSDFCRLLAAARRFWSRKSPRQPNRDCRMGKFVVTFVRHGETEYNARRLLQGQTDIPLNETGLSQAEALGQFLAEESLDRIYSSDLSRCIQTADGVVTHAKTSRPCIIKDQRLRERNFGSFEAKPIAEYRASSDKTELKHSGGETVKQVVDRAQAFMREVCREIQKEFGSADGNVSTMATITSLDDRDRGNSDGEIEVVFTNNDKQTLDTEVDVNQTTPDKVSGTEDCTSSTTPEARDGTESRKNMQRSPHVFVSSHGFFLRSLIQSLQKHFEFHIPGGVEQMKSGWPNTGMSRFIVSVDNGGAMQDMECVFVHKTDHLDGDKGTSLVV